MRINRVIFNLFIIAYMLTIGSSLACVQTKERPNLLFILSDDQRDDSFSGMGHPWVKTPNVDKLLSKGIRFENAYIAEPTCRPSRAALLLGSHERVNQNGFSTDHKLTKTQWADSYPTLLHDAGYETGYVGKWHVSNNGFSTESLFDYYKGHQGSGPFYFKDKQADGSIKIVTTNRRHTNSALEFLRMERNRNKKPFCLSVSYATPHGSKVKKMHEPLNRSASEDERLKEHPIYGGKYRNLDIPYPLQNPDDPYKYIPREVMDQEQGRSGIYNYDYDPVMNKEHHFRYYQMITEIDQMVGELMAELEKQGLAGNTIIVYASDHGLLMGEYGMGGKGLLYDLSSKFPCFVYDPTAPKKMRGISSKELVTSLDITTTLLDYAGVEPTKFMWGRSLKPLVRGEILNAPWRQGLYIENMYTGRDTPLQEGYVDGEWKYIRFSKAPHPYNEADITEQGKPVFEMLFNLKADPEEKNNLIYNIKFKQKLEELRGKCNADYTNLVVQRKEYAKYYKLD